MGRWFLVDKSSRTSSIITWGLAAQEVRLFPGCDESSNHPRHGRFESYHRIVLTQSESFPTKDDLRGAVGTTMLDKAQDRLRLRVEGSRSAIWRIGDHPDIGDQGVDLCFAQGIAVRRHERRAIERGATVVDDRH